MGIKHIHCVPIETRP